MRTSKKCLAFVALMTGATVLPTSASPNDSCPGLPFVEDGFSYECEDNQAILVGCADKQDTPISVGQTWQSSAGAFPGGTQWGFVMKCEQLDDNKIASLPVGCFVNDTEFDADDDLTLNGTFYNCTPDESGKLNLTFKPACIGNAEDCDASN